MRDYHYDNETKMLSKVIVPLNAQIDLFWLLILQCFNVECDGCSMM